MSSLRPKILEGLLATPKQLPAALLYDDLGSVLFEAITLLPEYGVTKADLRLLEAHAADVIRAMGDAVHVVELGPGSGIKAKIFLEAALDLQPSVHFSAVDVSRGALDACRRTLEVLPDVDVELVQDTYLEGLARVARSKVPPPSASSSSLGSAAHPSHAAPAGAPRAQASRRAPRVRRLVLFLGSNLSNFERGDALDFIRSVRERLQPGDGLLLATDLEKPEKELLLAYDDALGVTAAFDKNVLLRLNREFGANFDLANFEHEARYSTTARRIEMHLRAKQPCSVEIAGLDIRIELEAGETIWTESSHRFSSDELRSMGEAAGFDCAAQWVDRAWPFAHTLLVATPR